MHTRRFYIHTVTACLIGALCAASSVRAHNWGCWTQPNRTVYSYNTAALSSQASAALSDWDNKTILAIPRVNYHTEISVFDGYYGNTGWAGLASIESYSGCNILHGHARVNRSYSYTSNGYRGIFCQEVGHLFGLDHSNDGGCMGGGYWYDINTYYTVVSHNVNDIYNKYIGKPAKAGPGDGTHPTDPGTHAIAFWQDRPKNLQEAASRSQSIVVATVKHVKPGPKLVVAVEGLDEGVDQIPTENIVFSVDKVLRGNMGARQFELFRTGNAQFALDEDPAYVVGERYVLFLTQRENGTYRVIAPEGRLQVTAKGLVPASAREFMSELRGARIESLEGSLKEISLSVPNEPLRLELRRNTTVVFRSGIAISYALPRSSHVKLAVYDVRGRFVRTLVNAQQDGGAWYNVEWDGTNDQHERVANGAYYVRLQTRDGVRSLAIVQLR